MPLNRLIWLVICVEGKSVLFEFHSRVKDVSAFSITGRKNGCGFRLLIPLAKCDQLLGWRFAKRSYRLPSKEDPLALIVLAHFCVLFHRSETHWFMKGNGARLLQSISERPDIRWHEYHKWPLEDIRAQGPGQTIE